MVRFQVSTLILVLISQPAKAFFDTSFFEPCGIWINIDKYPFNHDDSEILVSHILEIPLVIDYALVGNTPLLQSINKLCFLHVHLHYGNSSRHLQNSMSLCIDTHIHLYIRNRDLHIHWIQRKVLLRRCGEQWDQRLFVVDVDLNQPNRSMWYFCCRLCKHKLLWIRKFRRIAFLNLVSLREHWKHPGFEIYYSEADYATKNMDEAQCNSWFFKADCRIWEVVFYNVAYSTKLNFSNTQLDQHEHRIQPRVYVFVPMDSLPNFLHWFSIVVENYTQPRIIYCNYGENALYEFSHLWFRHVSIHVWLLLLVACFTLGILKTHYEPCQIPIKISWAVGKVLLNFWFALGLLVRQGWRPEQVKSILCFQVMSVLLVCLYENYIVFDLVVPAPKVAVASLTDLMNQSYTYACIKSGTNKRHKLHDWVKDSFRRQAHATVLLLETCCDNNQLLKLLWKQPDGSKYALHNHLMETQSIIERLNVLVGYKYPCHSIHPIESVFTPQPLLTVYRSPVYELFRTTHLRLYSVGFQAAFEQRFKMIKELNIKKLRRLVENHDQNWKIDNAEKEDLLFKSVIRLAHWYDILKLSAFFSVTATVIFGIELYNKYHALLITEANQRFETCWLYLCTF